MAEHSFWLFDCEKILLVNQLNISSREWFSMKREIKKNDDPEKVSKNATWIFTTSR